MAVQGVTRLQAKIRSKQQRNELIAGARDDFLAICRRLDEGAPPEIAARPRWPGPGEDRPSLFFSGVQSPRCCRVYEATTARGAYKTPSTRPSA